MASFEIKIRTDFDEFVRGVERSLYSKSITISREFEKDLTIGGCRVRVTFERFSYFGGNRVSMHVTYIQRGDLVELIGVSAGGSSAKFIKINTVGEEEFLWTLKEAVYDYCEDHTPPVIIKGHTVNRAKKCRREARYRKLTLDELKKQRLVRRATDNWF